MLPPLLNSGNAIGDFASGSGPAIGLNGLYYSFTLQASGVGSGTILFDSTPGANQYAADDTGFNFAPLSTGGPWTSRSPRQSLPYLNPSGAFSWSSARLPLLHGCAANEPSEALIHHHSAALDPRMPG